MRIGFVGTQSVGKTTLVNELAKLPQFKDYYIATERSKYLRDLGIPLNTDSTIKGQTVFLAERVSELLRENVLTDRTVIDVMSFTASANSINYEDKTDFLSYASKFIKEYDYIFYISPEGVSIEDNGVREIDTEYRDKIDSIINNLISLYGESIKNFHVISGSTENRIERVMNVLKF